jgi:hypothetical protein
MASEGIRMRFTDDKIHIVGYDRRVIFDPSNNTYTTDIFTPYLYWNHPDNAQGIYINTYEDFCIIIVRNLVKNQFEI